MNVVVVTGRLTRPAERRVLASGDSLVALEMTSDGDSVPVAWPDPPDWAAELDIGDEVVVLARVRRRFFRCGGATQSRTEVVAERVAPAGRRRQVAALVKRAAAKLEDRE